ncbi:MAG: PHP-associated domain-containing protein, partial [Dehalococcoidia bacterium]|nr:PHP-associated domain-containing protein [Dehalococcoidia bacterium]
VPSITIEEACRMPIFQLVQGMEVCNGATHQRANDYAREVCVTLGMNGTGGSDAHSTVGVGSCATLFENPISCQEDLVRELKARRFRAVVRKDGSFL